MPGWWHSFGMGVAITSSEYVRVDVAETECLSLSNFRRVFYAYPFDRCHAGRPGGF
jgi:hypothetical protein